MRWWVAFLLGLPPVLAQSPPGSQSEAEAAVVVIRTPTGEGSGFLAALDGRTYIVTNQHVLLGTNAADVRITFIDGTKALPTRAEISADLDLVRLEIKAPRPPLSVAPAAPRNGDAVLAIGNSLGAGVITTGAGTIQGVGENEIETDCDFVPGNSGGPILDAHGHVLGVATYIRLGEKSSVTAGTRYAKGRRFAVRLRDGLPWQPVADWARYAQAGATIESARRLGAEVYEAARAIATNSSLANFKPTLPLVASAVADFERLQTRLARMEGQPATAQDLARHNGLLGATYRTAFQKLREACGPALRALGSRKFPPAWGWLEKQRQSELENLKSLQRILEDEGKKKPTFLSF